MKFENGFRPYFDFAIFDENNNLKFLIEYNGIQHYEYKDKSSGWNNKENFKNTQNRDKQKIRMCEELGIPLEIVPYFDFENLNNIISNLLFKYKI